MKKRFFVFFLALALAAAAFAGCGAAGGQSASSPEGQYLEGTVQTADQQNLLVEAAGALYLFDWAGATLSGGGAVQKGDEVMVYYTGTLKQDSDSVQPVTVQRVEVMPPTESASAAVQSVAETSTRGTITALSSDAFTIETEAGEAYSFTLGGVPVEGDVGLLLGEVVDVYYYGELNEELPAEQVQATIPLRVAVRSEPSGLASGAPTAPSAVSSSSAAGSSSAGSSSAPAVSSAAAATAPPAQTWMLQGILKSVKDNRIRVAAPGLTYQFDISAATIDAGPQGLRADGQVAVYFEGELQNTSAVQDVLVLAVVQYNS